MYNGRLKKWKLNGPWITESIKNMLLDLSLIADRQSLNVSRFLNLLASPLWEDFIFKILKQV